MAFSIIAGQLCRRISRVRPLLVLGIEDYISKPTRRDKNSVHSDGVSYVDMTIETKVVES